MSSQLPSRWSLSMVTSLWSGLIIAGAMAVYAVNQYVSVPEATVAELLITHAWHVAVLGGLVYALLWFVFRAVVLKPVDKICAHLYRIGTGQLVPIELESRITEVGQIVEGVNLMVKRAQFSKESLANQTSSDSNSDRVLGSSDHPAGLEFRRSESPSPRPAKVRRFWVLLFLFSLGSAWFGFQLDSMKKAIESTTELAENVRSEGQSLGADLTQLVANGAETRTRISQLEVAFREADSEKPVDWEDPAPAPELSEEEIEDPIQPILARLNGLETALAALETGVITPGDLQGLESRVLEELERIESEFSSRRDEILDSIRAQRERLENLDEIVSGLQGGQPRGVWREIEKFLNLGERGFDEIRGAAVREGKIRDRGVTRYRSRESFAGAEATYIVNSSQGAWCEVVLARDTKILDGQKSFAWVEDWIERALPLGWVSKGVIEKGYLPAIRVINTDDGRSFLLGSYDYELPGGKYYVTSLRFDGSRR